MQTKKLYENDVMLKSCTACVLCCEKIADGYQVVLDQTVIFPEGGGQLSDEGTINGCLVTHALEKDGCVVHYTKEPLLVGAEVTVELNWAVRFDHMQQHAGEHILSHAFWHLFGANNIGFHMNKETVTIDLDKELTAEEIAQAEEFANEQIWANHPIRVSYLPDSEVAKLVMRKKNDKIKGLLRIVAVEQGDTCTCCGTHPPFTGMIGAIIITRCDRHKNGLRVEFLCGQRALKDTRQKNKELFATGALLSVKTTEVTQAVMRLQEEIVHLNSKLKLSMNEVFTYKSKELLLKAKKNAKGTRVLCFLEEQCDAKGAKALAQKLAGEANIIVGLVYTQGQRVNYLFAASEDASGDCRLYCQKANELFLGKGGGNAQLAQGSGSDLQGLKEKVSAVQAFMEES